LRQLPLVPCKGSESGVLWERDINSHRLRAFSLKWRWGISARLGVAFAAIAGLAVAANLLIEHQSSVTSTTRVVRITVPSLSPPAAVATQLVTTPSVPQKNLVSPKSLIAAIEHLEVAIRSRLDVRNEDSDVRLASAVRELERETQAYVSQPNYAAAAPHLEKLHQRLVEYRSRGDELIRAADSRQNVLKEFWDRFDALDARTKASLAGSWKIFGRVIARKSLVDLNTSLDDIRRGFASLPTTDLYDQGALDAVKLSERALTVSLQTNETALTSSQGEAWVEQTRADLARINALQESLILQDAQRRAAEGSFAKESLSLMALAKATRPTAHGASPDVTREIDAILPLKTVARPIPSIGTSGTAAESLSEPATETTSSVEGNPEKFTIIFWVSGGVLTLLLGVSIRTVMSVVGPVRRIRAATLKIASGDAGVQVMRGGIRELDDLALSFNQMAEQLAEARANGPQLPESAGSEGEPAHTGAAASG
jgi:HAMP domain-containing protein